MRLDPANLRDFYESAYAGSGDPADAERGGRWRELSAGIKADHICRLLLGRAAPQEVVEVGCGDGAVLDALSRRRVGQTRTGLEIAQAAVDIAANRPGVTRALLFDGEHIMGADQSHDLAICTHVLEHLASPLPLLREIRRVARLVIVEVPLEDNLLARRRKARALSEAAGHLQRFSRSQVRGLAAAAGLAVESELLDSLPVSVHAFDATGTGRAVAVAKSLTRRAIARAPRLGERLITMHYAMLAAPSGPISAKNPNEFKLVENEQ